MPEERVQWGRQAEFILTLVGYAVGLGNVWRFPYLCYRNGGGAFLIPYVICLIFMGIPLFALEISFGQFVAKGPISCWDVNPLAKGVGFASLVVSCILMVYYSVIIAWALRFLIASLTSSLPWESCDSCDCLLYSVNQSEIEDYDNFLYNNSYGLNCTGVNLIAQEPVSPSEIFFNDKVLRVSKDITETGSVQWELLLCNMACFAIVFAVLYKGITSLGKVVYFTATFPYVLLTILLIRGSLLEGAGEGIKFYLTPRWERLGDAQVWSDAAVQIFFSLSCCSGGLIAMASYNNFRNNVIRDSLLVPIINCATSFYAGFVVFATLGYMAHVKQTSVDDVTTGGPGLAFVVYPEAIAQMPVSPLWAILFFVMLCILGFSSQFSTVETVITAFIDEYPHHLNSRRRVVIFRVAVCAVAFLLGLPMITQSGSYLLDLVDGALLGFPMLTVGLLELLVICILYGYNNFAEDIRCMVGRTPFLYFRVCWQVVSPVLLVAVIIFKAFQFEPHPVDWANLLYWLIAIFPISCIPAWIIYSVCTKAEMTQPTEQWWARRRKGTVEKELSVKGSTENVEAGSDTIATSPTPGSSNGIVNEKDSLPRAYLPHREKTGDAKTRSGTENKNKVAPSSAEGSSNGIENPAFEKDPLPADIQKAEETTPM
ncbi:sodium- and chloride-dependent glycine transporter 1-like [Littorina saxatilis]|uniref:sodium- and chloride-dependent glycine transporter 1-like n=1 Tax=Littorina saxatilis TaxID=31220 RepID=UPI0038B4FE68